MQRILVAFTSADRQTEKVAHHVARELEDAGLLVRLVDIRSGETEAGSGDCDGAIVAGSLRQGRFDPELYAFVQRHGETLRRCSTSAFLPVSMAGISPIAGERIGAEECVRNFTADVGWTPDEIRHTGGALYERDLNPVERASLHSLLDRRDAALHAPEDVEGTDWAALNQFVHQFAARILP